VQPSAGGEAALKVCALYRYPVKGFTPEACESLRVLDAGRIAGDRVLGFRFADAKVADDEWGTKHEFVALVNTPGLARLRVAYDHAAKRLRIGDTEASLDAEGRRRLSAALESYVLSLPENPLSAHPGRLPIRLVGDGTTPRYQDSAKDFVTLHGRASLAALAAATAPDVSELRFRSNIAVEGLPAWEELAWEGRSVRVGAVQFRFVRQKGRCLATHANPRTGERDLQVMQTLLRLYPAKAPMFAVALATVGAGGVIRVGDPVTVQ
jgi:uncharacterized protein YcbX